jgi:hypothetical protein
MLLQYQRFVHVNQTSLSNGPKSINNFTSVHRLPSAAATLPILCLGVVEITRHNHRSVFPQSAIVQFPLHQGISELVDRRLNCLTSCLGLSH